jgi:hypothetical protein
MSSRSCFFWGAFGCVLPELIKYYQLATKLQLPPNSSVGVWVFYVVVSFIFMLAAGAFTWAWRPRNRFQAIWVGISFPAIVGTLLQVTPVLPK